jgi:hypothetical protein
MLGSKSGTAVLTALTVLAVSCAGAGTALAGQDTAERGHYSTKAPYEPRGGADEYRPPPGAFEPVFTQHVARHGSRLLSSLKYDDLTLQLWEIARDEGALTELGERLGPDVEALMEVHADLGYGELTGLGAREHEGMARRVHERLPGLFEAAARNGESIAVVTSGKDRAVDSGERFVEALVETDPALADLVGEPVTDTDLLYFHKSEANQDYQDYLEEDPRLQEVLAAAAEDPETHAAGRRVLERVYTAEFVDRLDAGEFDLVDNGKGETRLNSVATAADYLYNLYIIAPGLAEEVDWDFGDYVTGEDARQLAYYADTQQFYEKGPGFEGDDITYRMSQVLLDDFFGQIEARRSGESGHAAVFRFAHAEQIIPFAALLDLPGAGQQVPEGQMYTYDGNPWRGDQVSPMGANIQWDVYAHPGGKHVVRMLVNEEVVPFREGCRPYWRNRDFYLVEELQRCLGHDGARGAA